MPCDGWPVSYRSRSEEADGSIEAGGCGRETLTANNTVMHFSQTSPWPVARMSEATIREFIGALSCLSLRSLGATLVSLCAVGKRLLRCSKSAPRAILKAGAARQARAVGRMQQQEKQRALGLVPGGRPAGLKARHDGDTLRRAHAPPPSAAALPQHHVKGWKSIRHGPSATSEALPSRHFALHSATE